MGVWGRSPQPPEATGEIVFGDFCSFLIKIPHFEESVSLNFYENLFLFLWAT